MTTMPPKIRMRNGRYGKSSKLKIKMGLSSKSSSVILPPLIVDGEPHVLHKMKLRELNQMLAILLKVCSGKTTMMRFTDDNKPSWWPANLPFIHAFHSHIPPKDPFLYTRNLIQKCYSFWKQEETLHMFDHLEGEKPRWEIVEGDGCWTLHIPETGQEVFRFNSQYQVLPFFALEARNNPCSAVRSSAKAAKDLREEEAFDKGKDFFRKRAISILGNFSPKHVYQEDDEPGTPLSRSSSVPKFFCAPCQNQFVKSMEFLEHVAVCRAGPSKTSDNLFFSKLGLFPKDAIEIWRSHASVKHPPKAKYQYPLDIMSRLEIASELGRNILRGSRSGTPSRLQNIDDLCKLKAKNPKSINSDYPVTYRPMKPAYDHVIQYRMTAADRRMARFNKRILKRMIRRCQLFSLSVVPLEPNNLKQFSSLSSKCKQKIEAKLISMRKKLQPKPPLSKIMKLVLRRLPPITPTPSVYHHISAKGIPSFVETTIDDGIHIQSSTPKKTGMNTYPVKMTRTSPRNNLPTNGIPISPAPSDFPSCSSARLSRLSSSIEETSSQITTTAGNTPQWPISFDANLSNQDIGKRKRRVTIGASPTLNPISRMQLATTPLAIISRSSSVAPEPGLIEASTLFKCHICQEESLFHHDAWQSIEVHMSLEHPNLSPFYSQKRQKGVSYHLLIVEAFLSLADMSISTKPN